MANRFTAHVQTTALELHDEAMANARLIETAPELLEALTYAREMLEEYEQARSGESFNSLRINAAIAKATTPT